MFGLVCRLLSLLTVWTWAPSLTSLYIVFFVVLSWLSCLRLPVHVPIPVILSELVHRLSLFNLFCTLPPLAKCFFSGSDYQSFSHGWSRWATLGLKILTGVLWYCATANHFSQDIQPVVWLTHWTGNSNTTRNSDILPLRSFRANGCNVTFLSLRNYHCFVPQVPIKHLNQVVHGDSLWDDEVITPLHH